MEKNWGIWFGVMTIIAAMVLPKIDVIAAGSNVSELKNQIIKEDETSINDLGKEYYINEVADSLIAYKSDLVLVDVENIDIENATISNAIPVFYVGSEILKPGEFKNRLTFTEWMFVVYALDEPIAAFFVKQNGDVLSRTNLMNSNFAQGVVRSMDELNTSDVIMFTAAGYFVLANEQDQVSIVEPQKNMLLKAYKTNKLRTFEQLEYAQDMVAREIDENEELVCGGDTAFLDYLYSEDNPGKANYRFLQYFVVGTMCIIFSIFYLER